MGDPSKSKTTRTGTSKNNPAYCIQLAGRALRWIFAISICDIDVKQKILSIYETIRNFIKKTKVLDQEKLHGIP
jgi:hypothetical protein